MTTYTMQGRTVPDDAERLAKIERLAYLMDKSIALPGTPPSVSASKRD